MVLRENHLERLHKSQQRRRIQRVCGSIKATWSGLVGTEGVSLLARLLSLPERRASCQCELRLHLGRAGPGGTGPPGVSRQTRALPSAGLVDVHMFALPPCSMALIICGTSRFFENSVSTSTPRGEPSTVFLIARRIFATTPSTSPWDET